MEMKIEPLALPGVDTQRPIVIAGPCSAETEEQVLETAQGTHDLSGKVPAATVDTIHVIVPFFLCAQGLYRRILHRLELPGVDIAFYLQYPLDELGVGSQHRHTPTRHIMSLTHGVHLDADLFGNRISRNWRKWISPT